MTNVGALRDVPKLCMAVYDRTIEIDSTPAGFGTATHVCQFEPGHDGGHSWQRLYDRDLEARRALSTTVLDDHLADVPAMLADVLEGIEAGEYDEWLELLLSYGHDRKRARRGVLGFRGRRR